MRKIFDIPYGENKENLLDLYLPNTESFDLFIYMHGGGLENGDKSHNQNIFEYLAENGIASASVNYKMYPNAKYPDFIKDSAAAVAWLKTHIGEYGKCNRIFIGGSSAGGYLSMMLCFDERWLGAHGLTANDFDGFVHDAGQPTKHFNVLREQGIDTRRVIVDDTAPLYHIGKNANYPPMLFIVSDNDMTNRYEQTMLTLSTLRHFGHPENKMKLEVRNGTHCHYVHTVDENGNNILATMIKKFITSC